MSVIIEDLTLEVDSTPHRDGGGEGEARPTESQQQQSLIDLMELTQERKARLVID